MIILLAICILTINIVRIISSLLESTIIIAYHENEGETYVLYVMDTSDNIRLWLAGTRCFKHLPPWAYIEPAYESPDAGRDFLRPVEQREELIDLYNCS